jgi:uncharacterized lipoprotein YmbA
MKKNILVVLLACTAIVWGCAASVGVGTGYPRLDTIPPGEVQVPQAQGVRPVLAVGPIGVPGYIVRARTITDSNVNMANISAADQRDAFLYWEIPRVITVDIDRLLVPKGIMVQSSGVGARTDYRIAIDLSAFDVTQFNTLETRGQWALYRGADAAPVTVRNISFSTPIAGTDNAAVRAAMSRALADLATMIVADFEGSLGMR